MDDTLKVRVRAPAERAKANAAVEKIIADAVGLPKKCARIVSGKTSRQKVIEISGLSESEVFQRLSKDTT